MKSRPVRLLAFWLLLLVPAIPVETAFGALACAHMPAGQASDAGEHVGHHSDSGGGDLDTDAHLGCNWLGPCTPSAAMLSSPATDATFLQAFSHQELQWRVVDAALPHPLAYLRPRPNAPPLQI